MLVFSSLSSVSASSISEVEEDFATFESKDLATGDISTYEVEEANADILPAYKGTAPYVEEIGTRSIIGADNRYQVKNADQVPYRYIAYVLSTFPNGETYRGTAWLFAPDVAITAAHVLYNAGRGGYATSVTIYPARQNDKMPYGAVGAKSVHVPTKYKESSAAGQNDIGNDVGVMVLKSNMGNRTGYFGIRKVAREESITGQSVVLSGYPSDKGINMVKSSGTVLDTQKDRITYNNDTVGGNSGCPVYIQGDDSNYYAVAVHSSGSENYNIGRKITDAVFNWFASFR